MIFSNNNSKFKAFIEYRPTKYAFNADNDPKIQYNILI